MDIIRDFAAHVADTIEELESLNDVGIEVNDDWTYTIYRDCFDRNIPKVTDILGSDSLEYEEIVDKVEDFINESLVDNINFRCNFE